MKYILLPIFFLTTLFTLQAQEKRHFIKAFRRHVEKETKFYRTYEYVDAGVRIEQYENGTLQLSAQVIPQASLDSIDQFMWYIKDFFEALPSEDDFSHFEANLGFYKEGLLVRCQFKGQRLLIYEISDAGAPNVLEDGNGFYQYFMFENGDRQFKEYRDSVEVADLKVEKSSGDTVYTFQPEFFDEEAVPPGGMENFRKMIGKKLKYPLMRRITGDETKFTLEFIVGEDGRMRDFRALFGDSNTYLFDEKIIKKLSAFPPWQPARFKGKPVAVRFLMPMIFELTD